MGAETIPEFLARTVEHVMTPDPVAVHPSQRLSAIRHQMVELKGHHMPVVEGDRFVGLLAPMDFLRVTPAHAADGDPDAFDAALDRATVRETMQEDVVTLAPGDPLHRACELFTSGGFHCLPVVDDGGALKGLLTTTDILRLLLWS